MLGLAHILKGKKIIEVKHLTKYLCFSDDKNAISVTSKVGQMKKYYKQKLSGVLQ